MSVHEQFAEDLALLALEALQGEERLSLEKHLQGCADCRRELERLRGDAALLALTTAGPKPPQRSRQRLLEAVSQEKRGLHAAPTIRWWKPVPWALAAGLTLAVAVLWKANGQLRARVSFLESSSAQQATELQEAREVVSTLTATDALRVTLVAAKTPPQPQGKAIYVRRRGGLIFLANNLPPLPLQKAYELWLIPTSGAPIPAGIFKPDARGSAAIVNPPLPPGTQAKAFAITVEPDSGSPSPTSEPIMLGTGE